MLKEIKYTVYIIIIFLFLFFSSKYYLSDSNKKNSYRLFNDIDKRISKYSKNLPVLKDDTSNIVEYVEENERKKKKFNFWKLIDNND